MKKTIPVIVGAAGNVGFSTATVLRAAGVPVHAIVRNEAKAAALGALGCAIATADLRDPESLARAFADAHAVQVIVPVPFADQDAPGEMRRWSENLATALERARPDILLAISDYGAHVPDDIGMPTIFHALEARLRKLDMQKIFLRSAEHMETLGGLVPIATASGLVPTMHARTDKAFATVSARDVGAIAAKLLLRPGADDARVVHAEGPRRYSANDVAATFAQLLGRDVTATSMPRAQWSEALSRRLGPSATKLIVDVYDAHNRGGLIDIEPRGEVRRGPTELADVLRPFTQAPRAAERRP